MTLLGTIVLDMVGLMLVLWLLNLVRVGRLYVGYGIVLLFAIVAALGIASVPPARAVAADVLHALFPGAELIVVLWAAFVLILIYVLEQLSRIVNRLTGLVQELALRDAERGQGATSQETAPEGTRRDY
jgi:hypothetical protein